MPAIAWPKWMGVPVVDGYGVDAIDRRETTSVAMGGELSAVFDVDEGTVQCSLFCGPYQANWLEGAERDLLRQGSRWMTMPLWMGGRLAERRVRFLERPKMTEKTGPWTGYSFALELARRGPSGEPEGGWNLSTAVLDDLPPLPKWPLRPPVVDGYGLDPADRRVTTEMEDGTVRRVEFDTDETVCRCSLFLGPDDAAWFEAFERDCLGQGSGWMIMPLWVGGRLTDHAVRFRERPKLASKTGGWSTYSFSLDLSGRRGLMPLDLQEGLTAVSPEDLMAASDLLDRVVNDLWPAALPFAA